MSFNSKIILVLLIFYCLDESVEQILLIAGREKISTNKKSSASNSKTHAKLIANNPSTTDLSNKDNAFNGYNGNISMINESSLFNDSSFNRSSYILSSYDLSNNSNSSVLYLNDSQLTKKPLKEPKPLCPYYTKAKDYKKELTDFMRHSYRTAIDLCNTSSRVGCKSANFLRQISNCVNDWKYFSLVDIINELNGSESQNDLPRIQPDTPVEGQVIFKVMNINTVSVKKLDFKMDFYMGIF